jgi:hypothetical protein
VVINKDFYFMVHLGYVTHVKNSILGGWRIGVRIPTKSFVLSVLN